MSSSDMPLATVPTAASPPRRHGPPNIAISVDKVTKSFPVTLSAGAFVRYRGRVPRRTVLRDISLQVHRGELFGLLGPNGAGKTTLLKMLATLCIPDAGQIVVSGIDARRNPGAVKSKIGLCTSEERSFYFRLTARANLRFFGSLMGLYGQFLEQRIVEVARLVDLTDALDRRFDTFSSGMKQRLSLARAIIGDPDIVFFDEPTRAVDPLHAREIRTLIRDELVNRQGKTAILATNILEEAWSLCDRVAVVHDGRIVAQGSPQTLDAQFTLSTRYHIVLSHLPPELPASLRSIPGVLRVTANPVPEGHKLVIEFHRDEASVDALLRALVSYGGGILSLRSEEPQPLDVFLEVTQYGGPR
jgi:ABC-2 type transport system ATP-binding protein